MPKKFTYEFVKNQFEKENFILLATNYKNAHQKLEYICPKGHKHRISWYEWNTLNNRCPYCAGNGKPTIEFIRKCFEGEGYILLSEKYENNKQKLIYICSKGHTHLISWCKWQQGRRCKYCGIEKRVEKQRNDFEFIKKSFEEEGYGLETTEYKNGKQLLKYVCPKGHRHTIRWIEWNRKEKRRCPTCWNIRHSIEISGPGHPMWKGGVSKEPYCFEFTKELKEFVKQRDGCKCVNPCCSGYSKILDVHHIDYNKKHCDLENLITICRSCNIKANKNRKWHTAWYRAIMYMRHGGNRND